MRCSHRQFASFFALRPHLFAWFLGAGASASSGIPTGYAMIRDFKTRIFCREVGYASKEVDAADPLWISRIDDFFRTNAILPPDGDPTEYSAAFEAVFPQERHRRQYIDDAVPRASLFSVAGRECAHHRKAHSAVQGSKYLGRTCAPERARLPSSCFVPRPTTGGIRKRCAATGRIATV